MGVIYTQGSDPATLEPSDLSESLAAAVREIMPWLASLSDADACRSETKGKWSAKQVIGHLTDSAVNNLGRIVRMQLEPDQHLPGYDQASWVRVQRYDERDWPEVFGAMVCSKRACSVDDCPCREESVDASRAGRKGDDYIGLSD